MANIINGTDTGSGGLITTGDSSDELQLQTAETARVTLTNTAVVVNEGGNDVDFRVEGDTDANLLFVDASADKVGIGTNTVEQLLTLSAPFSSTPTGNIRIKKTGTNTVDGGSYIQFDTSITASDTELNARIEGIRSNADNGSSILRFKTTDASVTSASTTKLTITSSGNAVLASGNLVVANGFGIDFSAHPNAPGATSELLDDYEEGTWTPDLQFGGAKVALTYSSNNGYYVKIGKLVYAAAAFTLSNKGTSTGTASIQGLPFNSANLTTFRSGASWGYYSNMSSITSPSGQTESNATYILLYNTGATAVADLTDANFNNNTQLRVSIVYRSDA